MQLVIFLSLYLILHIGVQTFDVTGCKIFKEKLNKALFVEKKIRVIFLVHKWQDSSLVKIQNSNVYSLAFFISNKIS